MVRGLGDDSLLSEGNTFSARHSLPLLKMIAVICIALMLRRDPLVACTPVVAETLTQITRSGILGCLGFGTSICLATFTDHVTEWMVYLRTRYHALPALFHHASIILFAIFMKTVINSYR